MHLQEWPDVALSARLEIDRELRIDRHTKRLDGLVGQ
jgi:hypothetical protein